MKLAAFRDILKTIFRLSIPYFRSEEKWFALGMLAVVIGLQLFGVWLNVQYNSWNNDFYNALQKRDWDAFVHQMFFVFTWIAGFSILSGTYRVYLRQWLQIRWRRWMVAQYVGRWMAEAKHYRLRLSGNPADNPDQRIAEDTQSFVDLTLQIGISMLGQIVQLASFIVILWTLSGNQPLLLFGHSYHIPGYLVWAALIYSIIGTILAHFIGRALITLNYMQQRYEADFRFALVRNRENGEEIALLHGEGAERQELGHRFSHIVGNYFQLMNRTKWLNFYQNGFGQLAIIFPFVVVAPLYFTTDMELGRLMQIAQAFGVVQAALSFFVDNYDTMAQWKAVIDRLSGFDRSLGEAEAEAGAGPALAKDIASPALLVENFMVRLPDGRPIVEVPSLTLTPRQRVLITGPSGSGKTSLLRALGGIWPFGEGIAHVPANADVLILPQNAYLPLGTLRAALAYPAAPDAISLDTAREALKRVKLDWLVDHIEEDANWGNRLSGGEQQRLAIARALIRKPDWLLLDEATSALDESGQAELYKILDEALPATTIISIGHRASLVPLHNRFLHLAKGEKDVHRIVEGAEPVLLPT